MAYSEWGAIDYRKKFCTCQTTCQRSLLHFISILVDALLTVKSQIQSDVFSWDELWCFRCGGDFSLAWISSDWFMLVLLAGWFIRKKYDTNEAIVWRKRRGKCNTLNYVGSKCHVFCTHFWLDRYALDAGGNLHFEQLIARNNKRDEKKRNVASRHCCTQRLRLTNTFMMDSSTDYSADYYYSFCQQWRHESRYKWCQAASLTSFPSERMCPVPDNIAYWKQGL